MCAYTHALISGTNWTSNIKSQESERGPIFGRGPKIEHAKWMKRGSFRSNFGEDVSGGERMKGWNGKNGHVGWQRLAKHFKFVGSFKVFCSI